MRKLILLSLLLVALGAGAATRTPSSIMRTRWLAARWERAARSHAVVYAKLEPAFSSVQVTDSNGARVDQGKAQISGNVMRIGLKALCPHLPGSLAGALGRHPQHGRKLYLQRRRP